MRRDPEYSVKKFISVCDLRYVEMFAERHEEWKQKSLAPDQDIKLVMAEAALKAGIEYLKKEHSIDYGKEQERTTTDQRSAVNE
jgi:hypothetical protein